MRSRGRGASSFSGLGGQLPAPSLLPDLPPDKLTQLTVFGAQSTQHSSRQSSGLTLLGDAPGGKCGAGYSLATGDKPGWGDNAAGGYKANVASAQACALLCTSNSQCKSFEYSPTQKKCNRNTVGPPPKKNGYKDFLYCIRASGMCGAHSSSLAPLPPPPTFCGAHCQSSTDSTYCVLGTKHAACE